MDVKDHHQTAWLNMTQETLDSPFCELKPGTLVRLNIDYWGDALDARKSNPRNLKKGDTLLYLGILDTSNNRCAKHCIKSKHTNKYIFIQFKKMHCWLSGEKVLCVNDFRPIDDSFYLFLGIPKPKIKLESELDAIEIVGTPK